MKKLIITACILFVSGIIIAGASIAGGAFEPVDLKAVSYTHLLFYKFSDFLSCSSLLK